MTNWRKRWRTLALAAGQTPAGALDRQLIIIGEEHPPYEIVNAHGRVEGINVDIATYIFGKLGVPFKIEILP